MLNRFLLEAREVSGDDGEQTTFDCIVSFAAVPQQIKELNVHPSLFNLQFNEIGFY